MKNTSGGKGFESEREILYQVLFDMRRDVTELKKLVHDIMSERAGTPINHPAETATVHYLQNPVGMVQETSSSGCSGFCACCKAFCFVSKYYISSKGFFG